MSRSRSEPLGVPGAYGSGPGKHDTAPRSPSAFDEWLLRQLNSRLAGTPVRIVSWAESGTETPAGEVCVRITDRPAMIQLLLNPELHFGDLYSAGRIEVHGDLLTLLRYAYQYINEHAPSASKLALGRRLPAPDLLQSRRNIHHHYDIGNDFYELWLDREALQYTCAYYADESMTIEQAQQAKMHHVCRKMWLRPGERVIEAGSGWGGFALFMAKNYGVKVRSFNISREQVSFARDWARRLELDDKVEFVEDDYRNISGQCDAFVSIGMLEHVGCGNYRELGKLIDRCLTKRGRGLIHTIGRDRPNRLNMWIDKRIFPGAYPPTLRQMMDIFEPGGLSVLDVENLRLHYARTLEAWLARYEASVDAVQAMFDDAFVRAWRLYLSGSIVAFQQGSLQLFQVLFSRSGGNQIPWTRAHLYDAGE